MTIELIELLESQINDIEKQVSDFIKKSDYVITSILGIGDMTLPLSFLKLVTLIAFIIQVKF